MTVRNVLSSSQTFNSEESYLFFQFRVLNYFMIIAVVFGFIIGFLGDKGLMEIGNVQPIADYIFAIFNIVLIWLLHQSKKNYIVVAWLFVISTLLLFFVALISVETDEARIVWFYITVYTAYMLLGVRSGLVFTLLSIVSISSLSYLINLNITDTAISTYLLALIVLSVLSRAHVLHILDYENKLNKQNKLLSKNINSMNTSLLAAKSASDIKSLFLANMSHEIRTPMNGVLSMAEVLENTSMDDKQISYLQFIKRSGDSLLELIDDLLDLSKIDSGTFLLNEQPFRTDQLIKDILHQSKSFFEESSSDFKSIVSDSLPVALNGDAARLKQVIINLISNAAKFTTDGEVELRIKGRYVDDGFLFLIEVGDTGIGIPDDQQNTIFEVFQQLSVDRIANKGVGIGLALCHKIIEKMNGSMGLVSKVNEGSCFSVDVVIPVVELDDEESDVFYKKSGDNLKVLVFEDDAISRLAVKTLLMSHGCVVDVVENGQLGIDLLSQQDVDVILMDIHMPVLDGVETTRLIKGKALSKAPVIGMTASVVEDDKKYYFKAGVDALVEKPIRVEALMNVISQQLSKNV